MTFSYDPVTPVGRVRFYLNDKEENNGPYPGKKNFSNEEIQLLLDQSGATVNSALIECYEALASAWSAYAVEESDQALRFNAQQVADKYTASKKRLQQTPIGEVSTYGSVTLVRKDHWE